MLVLFLPQSDIRGQRRRWTPLDHWKGERIFYKQDDVTGAPSAVVAERLGVLTPASKRHHSSTGGKVYDLCSYNLRAAAKILCLTPLCYRFDVPVEAKKRGAGSTKRGVQAPGRGVRIDRNQITAAKKHSK